MIYMVSRYTLSPDQVRYLTSQKATITNLSENKRRMALHVGKIFNTLSLLLETKKLTQNWKDLVINPTRVSILINSLTQHNPQNTNAQEVNKQEIVLHLIEPVLAYYHSRYKDQKIIIKEIEKFQTLANDLKETAENEKREEEATIMYRTRLLPNPPLIDIQKHDWTALCMQCFSYSLLGKKKEDAIKNIRHAKNCSFHKEWKRFGKKDKERVVEQFFKTTKPTKKA